jgi:hypothetical protein
MLRGTLGVLGALIVGLVFADALECTPDACGGVYKSESDGTFFCSCHMLCLFENTCCDKYEEACPESHAQAVAYAQAQQQMERAPQPVHDPAALFGACGIVDDEGTIADVPNSYTLQETNGSCAGFCNSAITDNGNILCHCDSGCLLIGDCCPDFEDVCPVNECLKDLVESAKVYPDTCGFGQCGRAVPSNTRATMYCYCDDNCLPNGDCCPDYRQHCEVPAAFAEEQAVTRGSCAFRCYTHSGDCWCDHQCLERGDCCDDYMDSCAIKTQMVGTIGVGKCQGNCGESSFDCFCDETCPLAGDCCSDFLETCPDASGKLVRHLSEL